MAGRGGLQLGGAAAAPAGLLVGRQLHLVDLGHRVVAGRGGAEGEA